MGGRHAEKGLGVLVPVPPSGKKQNGGKRPGAGRPPGISYKRLQDTLTLKQKYPIMPLEHMLKIINDEKESNERKDDMAKAAAPFIHPRLAAIHVSGNRDVRHSIDVTKLTDEELAFFERIVAKAQVIRADNGRDQEEDIVEASQIHEGSVIIDEEGNPIGDHVIKK